MWLFIFKSSRNFSNEKTQNLVINRKFLVIVKGSLGLWDAARAVTWLGGWLKGVGILVACP